MTPIPPMTAMNKTLGVGFSVLLALSMAACGGGPRGRVMSDSEEDQVGSRSAGAETYDRLVATAVEKLLSGRAAAFSSLGQKRIAVMPIENKGAESVQNEDWAAQLFQIIASTINQSERFRTINPEFLNEALRVAHLGTKEIYLPAGRRKLAETLEQQGAPVDLVLLPTLTTGTTNRGAAESQRNYLLGLVLVDIKTGEEVANITSDRIRKEYSR